MSQRSRAVVLLAAMILTLIGLGIFVAGDARAAEGPMGDGDKGLWDTVWGTVTDDCQAIPRDLQGPAAPLAGPFMEPPTDLGAAQGNWGERGFAGLQSFTFDMGCTATNAPFQVAAQLNTATANEFANWGMGLTALADYLDRLSWSPGWLGDFFGDIASTLVRAFTLAAFLPYIAIGLIFTVIVLLFRARHGQSSTVALGSAWAATVVVVATLVMTSPLAVSGLVQNQGAGLAAGLWGGDDPTTAATAATVDAIHYQGAQRRMFGDDPSQAALDAFPTIYRSVGLSWAEQAAIKADPAQRRVIWEAKMQSLNEAAATLEEADPTAYRKMTGLAGGRTDPALLEFGYAAAANVYRIFAALLRVLCIVAIFVVGLAWLFAAPFIVTPQGEQVGKGLLNNSLRAVGYAAISILGSFGFAQWARFALEPGVTMGTSVLLLVLGTVVFWALTRPDRKILSLATAGKVTGYGGLSKFLVDKLGTAAATYFGAREGAEAANETTTSKTGGAKPTPSEEYDPPIHEGKIVTESDTPIYQRTAVPAEPTVIDGEVIWEHDGVERVAIGPGTAGPGDAAAPSPEVTYGEVEIYQRSDA